MWQRIREIVRKEFRQAFREPRMRAMLFVPPIVQLLVFGYAVNMDVERGRIAWMDQDRTPESRELLARLQGSPRLEVAAVIEREEQLRDLLDRGAVQAVVRVLPDFARSIRRGDTAAVQIVLDGSDSNTASIVAGYLNSAVASYAARVQAMRARQKQVAATMAAGAPVNPGLPRLDARTRVWFNPDLRSRNYFVPGVVVNIITLITLMLTAMAIVREKEIGTMEQLMVTPIRPIELIIGKTLPFALVGLVDLLFTTLIAVLLFHVPLRGNLLLLLLSAIVFLMTTLGVGLFISTISDTQQQALMSSFFFFNPAFMLSGFAFPIRNMPEPVQYFTYLNPVRYFMEIVRALFLKGAGWATLWPQLAAMTAFGVVILSLSALRFHKRLD